MKSIKDSDLEAILNSLDGNVVTFIKNINIESLANNTLRTIAITTRQSLEILEHTISEIIENQKLPPSVEPDKQLA